jgi:zinc protease
LVVGISGDVSEQEAAKLVDEIFKGLPLRYTGKSLPDVNIEFSKAEEHIDRASLQNIGLFFAKGPARLDEDFYPTIVATHILAGSSLNSRIHHKAREAEGLTYGVYGSWGGNDKINFISGEFSSTAENFDRLKQIVQEEWNNLGQSGVTDSEVEQIKNYMLAADALRYADIQNISETLVFMQKEKLGLDFLQKRNSYVQKISVDDVNQAAKKYFTPDNFRLITMGESKKEERQKK